MSPASQNIEPLNEMFGPKTAVGALEYGYNGFAVG
jgi:hypothetical protein